jgi:hypothetical protein
MQLAIKHFISQGGYDTNGEIKLDESGQYVVKLDPIANLYNVNRNAFRSRIEGKLIQERLGRPNYLSEHDESLLLDLLTIRALIGRPMSALDLKLKAKHLAVLNHDIQLENPSLSDFDKERLLNKKKKIELPSRSWYYSFMERYNNEIGLRIGKLMDKNKTKAMSRDKLNDFYELLNIAYGKTNLDFINNYILISKIIFNCDETGICLSPKQVKLIMPRGLNPYCINNESHFEYTTVLACGNAAEDILSPMIIYRNLPETIPNTFMSWDGPLYKSSKTGWINTALFNDGSLIYSLKNLEL